ncbi:hypothetical protein CCHOA_10940 [Corynebacterium choanae]|uniref:Uncharacterized protein n=1 Tax=Corynebacterium choanae TaxID=1862358 RepID=A0A3G6J994_9CORY|nr:hypothetical protein CCHOA_10940 [Corynebacterium choanae]
MELEGINEYPTQRANAATIALDNGAVKVNQY